MNFKLKYINNLIKEERLKGKYSALISKQRKFLVFLSRSTPDFITILLVDFYRVVRCVF